MCAGLAHRVDLASAADGKHLRAACPGDLDQRQADPAGRARDQHGLAFFNRPRSDQLSDAYGAVAPLLQKRPGGHVLVVGGLACLGLWVVMFAAALGAEEVVYIDSDPEAVALAELLGATRAIAGELPDRVDGDFADAVDCGADPERSLPCALRSAAPGGHVVGRCVYFAGAPLP
jgi:hypothetical protein